MCKCTHQDIPVVKDLGGLHQCNLAQTWPSFLVQIKQVWQHNLQRIFSADEICIQFTQQLEDENINHITHSPEGLQSAHSRTCDLSRCEPQPMIAHILAD